MKKMDERMTTVSLKLSRTPFLTLFLRFFLIFFLIWGVASPAPAMEKRMRPHFEGLKKRLEADGFSRERLKAVYSGPDVFFDTKSVSLFFTHMEGSLNYGQFSAPASIQKARTYMLKHAGTLELAREVYGSSPEVITAILLVETRLGSFVGRSHVLSVLSTLSSLSDAKARKALWAAIPAKKRMSLKKFKEKARKKSAWAYKELAAFLRHTQKEKIDPGKILGSYAGAMGIPQFMPSNIAPLARDGDMDGRVDLFSHADAIMSVGHYLERHGWRPGLGAKKARKVIFSYNRSDYYVDAILKIAKLLDSKQKKD
ncbi:Protein MltB [Candidatus Desulfarcum epimagneticum]|uniref:Protein MltB n=1 Tax=uncultured Desulfobacteraceae bacterium TaxID=218296 RepID=A0A484HDI1_9BACT|nr:Protein MltB [uncultured Desulfobacteraceae bacterium]